MDFCRFFLLSWSVFLIFLQIGCCLFSFRGMPEPPPSLPPSSHPREVANRVITYLLSQIFVDETQQYQLGIEVISEDSPIKHQERLNQFLAFLHHGLSLEPNIHITVINSGRKKEKTEFQLLVQLHSTILELFLYQFKEDRQLLLWVYQQSFIE